MTKRRRKAGPRLGNLSTTSTSGAHTSQCKTQDQLAGGVCDCGPKVKRDA